MDYEITFYEQSFGFNLKPVDKNSVWFGIANKDCAAIVTRFSPMDNGEISEAEKTGKIFIGDLLVKVQGDDVLKMNFKELSQYLHNVSRPVTLTFRTNRQVPSTYFRDQKHHDLITSAYHTKEQLPKIQEDVQFTLEDYFNIKKIREEDSNIKIEERRKNKEDILAEGQKKIDEQNELKKQKEEELEAALVVKQKEYNSMLREKKTARLKDEEGDLMYFACMGCKSSVEEIKHHVPHEVEGKSDIDPSPLFGLIQAIKKYEEIKQLYLFAKNCQNEEKNSIDWNVWMKNIAEISVSIQTAIQDSPAICICVYNILKDNVTLLEIAGRELKKRMDMNQ